MFRTPIQGDTGPDERDERFAVALALLLPEVFNPNGRKYYPPDGNITASILRLASEGFYRPCGYPHTNDMELWPPFIEDRPHLLPAIREIWRQCYTTT